MQITFGHSSTAMRLTVFLWRGTISKSALCTIIIVIAANLLQQLLLICRIAVCVFTLDPRHGSQTFQQALHTGRSRAAKLIHILGRPLLSSTCSGIQSSLMAHLPVSLTCMTPCCKAFSGGNTYCCNSLTCSAFTTLPRTQVFLVPVLLCFHSGKLPGRQDWCYHNSCPSTCL